MNVIINNRKPRIGSVPNDFALYQMPKGEFVVGSMTIVPSLDIVMNKEEQAKAKEAEELAFQEQFTEMDACLCCWRFHQGQNNPLPEWEKDK